MKQAALLGAISATTVILSAFMQDAEAASTYTATAVPGTYIDISATGTPVAALGGTDDSAVSVNLPFTFNFYGTNYTQVFVSSNGLLTFASGVSTFTNTNLASSPVQPTIAPFWDDLQIDGGAATSGVYTQVSGSPGDREFIIDWHDVRFFSGGTAGDTLTFQTVLSESNNTIQFNYRDLVSGSAAGNDGASATVGISTGLAAPLTPAPLVLGFNSGPNSFVGTGQTTLVQQNGGVPTGSSIPFSFTDISATGTLIPGLVNADDGSTNVSLPFTFNFGGIDYNDIFVSSNGLLTFGSANATFTNSDLTSSPAQAAIAAFWDDLSTAGGVATSGVYTQVTGATGSRQFIIDWNEVRFFSGGTAGDTLTFEAILFEGTNDIVVSYRDLISGSASGNNGASATVGIRLPTGPSPTPESLLLAFNNGPNGFVGTGQSTLIQLTEPGGSVPEPTTLALLSLGLAGLAASRRRKQ